MSKTVKIAVSVGVCIICLLSVLFGCLFGIKCHITFDYGFEVNTPTPTSQDYDSARNLIIEFSNQTYLEEVDVTRFTTRRPLAAQFQRKVRKIYGNLYAQGIENTPLAVANENWQNPK